MDSSAYRYSPEHILTDEPNWEIKHHYAAKERDRWQDRAYHLERELEKAQELLRAVERADLCAVGGCIERKSDTGKAGLCYAHMYAGWQDMHTAWNEEVLNGLAGCGLPAEFAKRRQPPLIPGIPEARPWVVYYIRMDSRVKIGRTVDLARRMRTFSAHPDQLLAVEPGVYIDGLDRETQRHHEFAATREAGTELFGLSPELEAHIATVRATFGDPQRFL